MDVAEELTAFCRQWDNAMIRNDAVEIGKFMHDDWVIVGTTGGITTRHRFLEFIRSGDLSHHIMSSDEMQVNLYGDTGIVISRGTSAGLYRESPFELYDWSTSVFIKKEGKWTCVVTMLTPAIKHENG